MIAIYRNDSLKYHSSSKDYYFPSKQYEDLREIQFDTLFSENTVFESVRELFHIYGLDAENYGKTTWNPLGTFIKPGQTVLLKPNLVLDKNENGLGEDCLYTSPAVVSPIICYVWKALQGRGKIIVADAPVQQCDFDVLIQKSGYLDMISFYQKKGISVELMDLRGVKSVNQNGILIEEECLNVSSQIIDLGQKSEQAKLDKDKIEKMRITNYDPRILTEHHNEQKHEYCISQCLLDADVVFNLPKPKAHRKAGITIGLKNFVGVNVRKEFLPHHRMGDKEHGGDEYEHKSHFLKVHSLLLDKVNILRNQKKYPLAKLLLKLARLFSFLDKKIGSKEVNREGSWHGNDTIWRTVLDINKIVNYCDKDGVMQEVPQRKIIYLADMVVVGEKEGPLLPSPKHAGILVIAEDGVLFDRTIATLFGFDYRKVPTLLNADTIKDYPFTRNEKNTIISNDEKWNKKTLQQIKSKDTLMVEPSSGWKNYIEMER